MAFGGVFDWGKHALFEESLHSPLIIRYPGIKSPGQATLATVETLDIFPTLCELAKLPVPGEVQGTTLVPCLNDPDVAGHPAYSYFKSGKTIRTESSRLILHKDGFVELYHFDSPDGASVNVAAKNREQVTSLISQIEARFAN